MTQDNLTVLSKEMLVTYKAFHNGQNPKCLSCQTPLKSGEKVYRITGHLPKYFCEFHGQTFLEKGMMVSQRPFRTRSKRPFVEELPVRKGSWMRSHAPVEIQEKVGHTLFSVSPDMLMGWLEKP
jgi:uncharacterized pyridoxamine 5'-phosphate oxidase family protein